MSARLKANKCDERLFGQAAPDPERMEDALCAIYQVCSRIAEQYDQDLRFELIGAIRGIAARAYGGLLNRGRMEGEE